MYRLNNKFVFMVRWCLCLLFWNISCYLFGKNMLAGVCFEIICFLLLKVYTTFSLKQNNVKIKWTDWVQFFLIPVGSSAICYVVWWEQGESVDLFQNLILTILLLINLAFYYLYQQIQFYTDINAENKFLEQQNKYFQVRYEEFEKQWLKLCRMRHDMTNNYVLEMDYLENGEYELLMEHYRDLTGKISGHKNGIYTGNIGIDATVNYKLETAKKLQIAVDSRIETAGKVTIHNRDLNILIGNLMDNAIEAVRNITIDKRRISILIRTDQTAFFLEIENPFEGERIKGADSHFLTDKRDKEYHGLGILEVKEIVRKYNGQMTIDDKENKFSIKVLIYMP